MSAPPKHRMAIVEAAAALFRRHGYAATGINEIAAASGAPKGSLYHYFPQGKEAIGAAAVDLAGARVAATLEELAGRHRSAAAMIRAYGELLAGWMERSGFRDGCPLTTTLLETAPQAKEIADRAQAAFAQWGAAIARALRADGVRGAQAERLARFALSAMEGSLVLARAERSARPIREAAAQLSRLFADAARI